MGLVAAARTLRRGMAHAWRDLVGLGYDAVEDRGRRKPPQQILRSEDDELTSFSRGQVITLGRDIRRNFAIAAWAIRKHLDYCSTFHFQPRTGDPDLDRRLGELVKWWSRAENFDASRRHGQRRFTRICEASRTVDGDVFPMLLGDGTIQTIEGDRIRTPTAFPDLADAPDWMTRCRNGIVLGPAGEAQSFAVNRRGSPMPYWGDVTWAANSFVFERLVPARNMLQLAYWDRFDQCRGISPLATALNSFRDAYEGFDYALAKAKISQLFTLVTTRNATVGLDDVQADDKDGKPAVDFNRGPVALDLDPGEDMKVIESHQPSSEWQAFMQMVVAAALKSLDIPYSFYDESHTNYSGSRGAWLLYDQSAEVKRQDLREMLDRLTAWRLGMFIARGTLVLPAGYDLASLNWEWVAQRIPWIDPLKEIQATGLGVDEGLDSTPAAVRRMGGDAYQLADEQAKYLKYRESIGLGPIGQKAPIPVVMETSNNAA